MLALNLGGCPATAVTHEVLAGTTTSSGATTSFTVNPQGSPTKYYVEYGLTPSYGKTTTVASLPNENGEQSATAALSGLETCTTYHYQVDANNKANEEAGSPGLGGDQSFKTSGCPAAALSVGYSHACGLLTHGEVGCWGENVEGSLGDSKLANHAELYAPDSVEGIHNATGVTTSISALSCALLATNHIECWGRNAEGSLGGGTKSESSATPVEVGKIANAIAVGSGYNFGCALLSTGHIDCWGSNEMGKLGTTVKLEGCSGTCSELPVAAEGIENATALSVGERNACAVLSTGHVECWGDGRGGDLGDGSESNSPTPVEVSGITNATEVTAGEGTSCALLSTGHIECWGWGFEGQLGDGTRESSLTPVNVSEISNATAVSEIGGTGCALLSTGHIECWGGNEYGEIGNGEHENSEHTGGPERCPPEPGYGSACALKPVAVEGITSATAVSTSRLNSCALETGGAVYCWGSANSGLLGHAEKSGGEVGFPTKITGFP